MSGRRGEVCGGPGRCRRPAAFPRRVAIAGAGITGAYLARLLKRRGIEARLYDPGVQTACGLTPCAWGASGDFDGLVKSAGLDPRRYILRLAPDLRMDGVRIQTGLRMVDKPRVLRELLHGTKVSRAPLDLSEVDLLVDATGSARAYLPPVGRDLKLSCGQFRVRDTKIREDRVGLGGVGYAWCFRLGDRDYHVGCGSLAFEPRDRLEALGWIEPEVQESVCSCAGEIRLTGPRDSLPFTAHKGRTEIWGIGEAIGCVSPLAGDGIVPGLKSVWLLLEHWGDPEGYTRAVLEEFSWMQAEREILDRLIRGRRLSLRDALVLRKNARRMNMSIGVWSAVRLLRAYRSS